MLILLSIKEEYMGEIGKGKNQTLKQLHNAILLMPLSEGKVDFPPKHGTVKTVVVGRRLREDI